MVGELTFVADLYNFGTLLSYIIVNVCLIVLRNKEPEAYPRLEGAGSVQGRVGRTQNLDSSDKCHRRNLMRSPIRVLILTFHESGRLLGQFGLWLVLRDSSFYGESNTCRCLERRVRRGSSPVDT